MQLAILTHIDGGKISINPRDVSAVTGTDYGTTMVNLISQPGEAYEVQESPQKATMLINRAMRQEDKITQIPQPNNEG